MKYKVGDKVRIRGDLEYGEHYGGILFSGNVVDFKNKIAEITKSKDYYYGLSIDNICYTWTSEMLRPAEFKIWCETEEEKKAVSEELEKEGYVWKNSREKPTDLTYIGFFNKKPCGLYIQNNELGWDNSKQSFRSDNSTELTPSEFTGIDFFKKIIITKTPTGATASYGDKTVTTEGDFEDASRQALAEVLCPFKVGDRVRDRRCKNKGIVTKIRISGEVVVHLNDESGDYDMTFKTLELLKPYAEPLYNAKLFCVKGSRTFDKGHIYEVKDGKFTDEYLTQCKPYKDLENVNETLYAQFMEVKGGLDE